MGARLVLIGFSLAIASIIAFWLTRAERRLQALAFGLIIGGAIGNVIDRIAYGAVADFLDFFRPVVPLRLQRGRCSHLGGRGRPYSRPVIERDRQEERCLPGLKARNGVPPGGGATPRLPLLEDHSAFSFSGALSLMRIHSLVTVAAIALFHHQRLHLRRASGARRGKDHPG